ncbi:MAG: SCO family protein [Planctomycetota bacterium]
MSLRHTSSVYVTAALLACGTLAPRTHAQTKPTAREVVEQVGFDQNLDAQVPLDLAFRDEAGQTVRLRDYFGGKPVVLTLVYYECPMLCTQVLNGLTRAMRAVSLEPGRDYEIVTITIDAHEGPELARAKKARYIEEYGKPEAASGWHFLASVEDPSAAAEAIEKVAGSIGFRYVYYDDIDQFAHASGFVALTPTGRVAKYFYGVEFAASDFRLALVESSLGTIGTLVDQVLLLCYHYDPTTGKYGFAIMGAIRMLGAATVVALLTFIVVMLRRERAAVHARGC